MERETREQKTRNEDGSSEWLVRHWVALGDSVIAHEREDRRGDHSTTQQS